MQTRVFTLTLLTLPALLAPVRPAQAGTLEVQGLVMDGAGRPQTGSVLLRFTLFSVASDAPVSWSESVYVNNKDGEFEAVLGLTTPIPDQLLSEGYRLTVQPPAATGWRAAATSAHAPREAPKEPAPPKAAREPLAGRSPRFELPAFAGATGVAGLEPAKPPEERAAPAAPPPAKARETKRTPETPLTKARGYKVREGDTLESVARKLWGEPSRWTELYEANSKSVRRGGRLSPGQVLVVPETAGPLPAASAPRRSYTVLPGDTLPSVARKLLGEPDRWTELYEANAGSIPRGGRLRPGQRLIIPGAR